MNAMRVAGALLVTFCCWPYLAGCTRVREPIGRSDDGEDRDTGADEGPAGSAGLYMPQPAGGRSGAHAFPAGGSSGRGGTGGRGGWGGWGSDAGLPDDGDTTGTREAGSSGHSSIPAAGASGFDGSGGFAGSWMYSGGTCACDDDDACSTDYCSADGCIHQSRVTEDTDEDDDGFYVGCDCDDANPDVRPTQTRYFIEPKPVLGYDYDCDAVFTAALTAIASTCEPHPDAEVCLGEGWVGLRQHPECGEEAEYQVCEFKDGACTARTVTTAQPCR